MENLPAAPSPTASRAVRFEFDRRARTGGWYYIAAWLVVAYASDLIHSDPDWSLAGVLLFTALASARVLLPRPDNAGESQLRRLQALQWALMIATVTAWGAVYTWVLLDPQFLPARPAALMCTVFFATAFATSFGMYPRMTALAAALVFLPGPLLVDASLGGGPTRVSLWLYSVYLLIAILRCHREYLERQQLATELREQRDAFEQLSRTDALTGLLNRGEFARRLRAGFEQAKRAGEPASLVLFDIDYFKQVNDHLGHAVGDRCLIAFAQRLNEMFALLPGHQIGRWGGEEFVLWLPGRSVDAAKLSVEAVLESLRNRPLLAEYPRVTCSAGMANLAVGIRAVEDWLIEADAALYQAKRAGRDRLVVASVNTGAELGQSAEVVPLVSRPKTSES